MRAPSATISGEARCAAAGGGFTLIEMLMVVLIMGLLAGLASTLTQPDERVLLRVEVDRLAQLLDLAASESRLGGRTLAWTAAGPGYRFWQYSEESGWSRIVGDPVLRPRVLPPGMTISNLRIENSRAAEDMRLEFAASVAAPAFSLDMALGHARFTMANSPLGTLRVSPTPGGDR